MLTTKPTKPFDAKALADLVDTLFTRLEDSKVSLADAERALQGAPESGAAYSLAKHLDTLKKDVERALARYEETTAASCALASGELLFDAHGKCSGCKRVTAVADVGMYAWCRACAAERPHPCARPDCTARAKSEGGICEECAVHDAEDARAVAGGAP